MTTSNCGDIAELEETLRTLQKQQEENRIVREMIQEKMLVLERELEPEEGEYYLSLVVTKPVFGVSDQARHKLDCTATADG